MAKVVKMGNSAADAAYDRALRGREWFDLTVHPGRFPPDGNEVLIRAHDGGLVTRALFCRNPDASPTLPEAGEVAFWQVAPNFSLALHAVVAWRILPTTPFCSRCGDTESVAPLHGMDNGFFRCGACNHEFAMPWTDPPVAAA